MTNLSFSNFLGERADRPAESGKPVVCVQGLGFVGSAMAAAVALARDSGGEPIFNVIGVDLPTQKGLAAVEAIRAGRFPGETVDEALLDAVKLGQRAGNLTATTRDDSFELADVVLVDINLDLDSGGGAEASEARVDFDGFRAAIDTIGEWIRPGTLVIVEVTVPPGTCREVVAPALEAAMARRGLPPDSFLLAHSYERVMPGADYLSSIVNFWRVYAGHTDAAAAACEAFFSKILNVRDYPLTRLSSPTASETAKVLENSYRATTIAFMEEWGRFAEAVGIDLFEVVDAIRVRPTHSNMRTPGFGVGGYCLTKDPLFAMVGARQLLGRPDIDFPFCRRAVETNAAMPLVSVDRLEAMLGGLAGKTVLLMGVSYRPEIGDTRYSPSRTFYEACRERGASVLVQDPMVGYWLEMDLTVSRDMVSPDRADAIVFAVAHREYGSLDLPGWLGDRRPAILDANNVLGAARLAELSARGFPVASIGRG